MRGALKAARDHSGGRFVLLKTCQGGRTCSPNPSLSCRSMPSLDYFETPYVGGLLPLRAFFRSRRVRQQGRCSIVLPHPPQMSRPLWDSLARGHRFSKWGMCLSYFLAPVSHTRSGLCEMANMADGESEWARPPLREVEPPVAGPNIHPESSLEDGRGQGPDSVDLSVFRLRLWQRASAEIGPGPSSVAPPMPEPHTEDRRERCSNLHPSAPAQSNVRSKSSKPAPQAHFVG